MFAMTRVASQMTHRETDHRTRRPDDNKREKVVALKPKDAPLLLSQREVEVLTWVARGKSNGAIADILGISIHTVDTHVRRIMSKLDVASRTTAAVRAAQQGLLPCV